MMTYKKKAWDYKYIQVPGLWVRNAALDHMTVTWTVGWMPRGPVGYQRDRALFSADSRHRLGPPVNNGVRQQRLYRQLIVLSSQRHLTLQTGTRCRWGPKSTDPTDHFDFVAGWLTTSALMFARSPLNSRLIGRELIRARGHGAHNASVHASVCSWQTLIHRPRYRPYDCLQCSDAGFPLSVM